MRLTISLIAATAVALVAAQPTAPGLPGDPRNIHPRAPQTNAKRFAAGLPPLPPRSRHSRVPYGGSKVDAARRAIASPSPQVNTACNILVKKASDGSSLGYITASGTIGAFYGPVQSARAGSLEVSFSYQLNGASSASQLGMLPARGLSDGYYSATYPYIGATISTPSTSNDLNPGVSTFAYITATEKTPPGSPPTSAGSLFNRASGGKGPSESAIWQYNPTTQAIAAQWVNSDTSLPTTYLAHTGSALFLTGDMSLLKQKYPAAVEVTFTCDPTLVSSPVN